ncbi:MAG: hypothetical protein ACYDC1_22015 [Limisphaerales bacterium]
MPKPEQKTNSVEVRLASGQFRKLMAFNRFSVAPETDGVLASFWYFGSSSILDAYMCFFSREAMGMARDALAGYLNRIGIPETTGPSETLPPNPLWKVECADIIKVAAQGTVSEVALYGVVLGDLSNARRALKDPHVIGQPIALLRSSTLTHKQFVKSICEYE